MTKPTINDVARIAGVSKKTVSRVINRSPALSMTTRARVEGVIAQIGFVPNAQARALSLGRNFLIALIHGEGTETLLPEVARGMHEALNGTEFALVVCSIATLAEGARANTARAIARFVSAHRPHGVLLLDPLVDDAEVMRVAGSFGSQIASLGSGEHADAMGSATRITSDDRAATAAAVSWLVSHGHRRIGLVAGPEETPGARQRELGYLDAMADHQLDRGATLVANGDDGSESGIEAAGLLLAISPRPTAIIAGTDAMAAGVLHAAASLGIKVPDELSVIGGGDTPVARLTQPPLTTLALPLAEMARTATLSLIDPAVAGLLPHRFMPELVVRGSTAYGELELVNRAPSG